MNAIFMLLSLLSRPRALISMGGLALIFMVYFFGPSIGLRGTARLIVILCLVCLFLGLQLFLFLRARRKKDQGAADLETSMIMEADQSIALAEAGQKRAREDARRELVAAIEVLKKSSLADGRGGKAALYVLPWYMVLGTGYSGKGSIISNSGLQRPGKGPGELRGIGASSNCEWWFTNHGVFLEADRRFATAAGEKAAEIDWDTFLTTLGKQRSRIPLNGVVLTVSAEDLLKGSASELEEQARLLRKRLDAVSSQLNLVFPIYLMVTKMDLVQGFNEYFAGLGGAGADQIFGATLRANQMRSAQLKDIVGAEFEHLHGTLGRRRQMRLIQDEHSVGREGTYLFPLQFRSLGDNLQRFVQVLCEPNAYGRNPLLRGFYFSSSGGNGQISDHFLQEMNRILGLPASAVATSQSERPLFLRDFFRKVLVPDSDIARPTRGAARKTRLIRRATQVAALAVIAALVVNLCVAFGRSLYLIKQTEDRARGAATAALPEHNDRVSLVDEQLRKLDPLREQLQLLDEADRGLGEISWMGLNRGQNVNEAARSVYLKKYTDIVSEPYVKELELWLLSHRPDVAQFDEYYRRYRAYRMMFEPSSGSPTLVAEVLEGILKEESEEGRIEQGKIDRLNAHVLFAMSHADSLEVESENKLKRNQQVIAKSDEYIKLHMVPDHYYQWVIRRINENNPNLRFDLSDIPQSSTMLTLRHDLEEDVQEGVPPSFTLAGWNQEVSLYLGNIDQIIDRDAWLLPKRMIDDKARLKTDLLNLYEEDYVRHWRRYLKAIVIVEPSSMSRARALLRNLQSEEFPYLQLLSKADENLTLGTDGGVEDAQVQTTLDRITGSFEALHVHMQDDNRGDDKRPQEEFHELVEGMIGKLDELSQSKSAHQDAEAFSREMYESGANDESVIGTYLNFANRRSNVNRVGGSPGSNEAFESVLQLPGLHAWQAILRDTERYLDELWKKEIYDRYSGELSDKYPFSDGANADLGIGDFGEFFGGSGVLKQFVDTHLGIYVDSRSFESELLYGNGLKMTPKAIAALVRGNQLREAFFTGDDNNPQFSFTLKPSQVRIDRRSGLWIKRTFFSVGDQEFGFGTGKVPPESFGWPSDQPGASIRVMDTKDSDLKVADAAGDWGLFRMMNQSEIVDQPPTRVLATWKKPLADGSGEVVVPCELTFKKSVHPFILNILDFPCPRELHR